MILLVGDLRRARTVKSLCYLLGLHQGVELVFASLESLCMTDEVRSFLDDKKISYKETTDLKSVLSEADAIYMTRPQDEYNWAAPTMALYQVEDYRLDYDDLKLLKESCWILHPLPRRQEIDRRIDVDPRALYWRQVENGVWMRMALMVHLFEVDDVILEK